MNEIKTITQAMLPQQYVDDDSDEITLEVTENRNTCKISVDSSYYLRITTSALSQREAAELLSKYEAQIRAQYIPTVLLELVNEIQDTFSKKQKKEETVVNIEEQPFIQTNNILTTTPFTIEKSTFYASVLCVQNIEEVDEFLDYVHQDPKTSDATHSIAAWRFEDDVCGYDEDGEDSAGQKLAFLMEKIGVNNCCVVVHRWFGGIKLGPKRFKIINECAKDAISLIISKGMCTTTKK